MGWGGTIEMEVGGATVHKVCTQLRVRQRGFSITEKGEQG